MWDKTKSGMRFAFDILAASGREYGITRANRMSAAVAYRAIFAAAPMLLIAVSIFGSILGNNAEAQQRIFDAIERFAGGEVADAFQTFLVTAITESGSAAIFGAVLLLWTSSSLFLELQHDLNDIFQVPYEHTAGALALVKKRGLGFLWTVGLGLGVVAIWLVNVAWDWFEGLFSEDLVYLHQLIAILAPLVSLFLLPILFALLFQSLTEVKVRRRAMWAGSIFTSVVFLVAAYGIGLYFSWDADTSVSQVAASFFVILLLAFALAGVFLFGAVVTKVYNDYLADGDVMAPSLRRAEDGRPEVLVAEVPERAPALPVAAFLGGLLLGWRRSRR